MRRPIVVTPTDQITLGKFRFRNDLPLGSKVLYAEFYGINQEQGYVPYNIKKFSEIYSVTDTTIRAWINHLVDKKLIKLATELVDGCREPRIVLQNEA